MNKPISYIVFRARGAKNNIIRAKNSKNWKWMFEEMTTLNKLKQEYSLLTEKDWHGMYLDIQNACKIVWENEIMKSKHNGK